MAPSSAGEGPRFLTPLLSAALSALVVVGVYEVRARGRRHTAPGPDGGDQPAAPATDGASGGMPTASAFASTQACGDLRRRYLRQCPHDLLGAAGAAPPAPPPTSSGPDPRAAAELSAWLNPSPDELDDMARRCEIRFEMPAITENQPPVVSDEHAAALSLSGPERASIDRTLRDMHSELLGFAQRALAGSPVPSANAATSPATLEEMLSELQTRPEAGFEEARERLAKERATSPTPIGPSAQQPPGERLLRTWATLGDQFERQLATEVGSERARQLRVSPQAGWMNRFSQAGCRSEPAPSSK